MTSTTHTPGKSASVVNNADIQCVCEQLKNDISHMLHSADMADEQDKTQKLHKLNELQQILSTIEDIEHAVDRLMKEQARKKSSLVS